MTFAELRFAIEQLLPGAQLDEDNEGQIVVYTNRMVEGGCRVVPFVEEEDQS
jgi:hypothetical protein|tara:strand:+ start:278 stop:433 length:156 start_codon:yes stop_codon:yes gene_type:complete